MSAGTMIVLAGLYGVWRDPMTPDWGFHAIVYYPSWIMIPVGILGLVVTAWLWHHSAVMADIGRTMGRQKHIRYWEWGVGILIPFISFWIFQQAYALWGDGIRILIPIREMNLENKIGFIQFYHLLWEWLTANFPARSELNLFKWTTPIGGLIYLIGLVRMAKGLGRNRLEYWLYGGIGLAQGTLQYFYGYVEAYALSLALQPWLIEGMVSYSKTRRLMDLLRSGMILAVMAYFHQMNVILAIPFLMVVVPVLIGIDSSMGRKRIGWIMGGIAVGLGLYGIKVVLWDWEWLDLYIMLFHRYSWPILMGDWCLQTINYLLLGSLSALLFPVIGGFGIVFPRYRIIRWGGLWHRFIILAGIGGLGYMMLPNLVYGPMDWDAGCALCLFPGLATATMVMQSGWKHRYGILAGLIVLSGLNSVLFIGLNHSPRMSVRRYLDLVEMIRVTSQRSLVGSAFYRINNNPYLHAQLLFSDLGLDSLAEVMAQRSMECSGTILEQARMASNLALQNLFSGDWNEAIRYARQSVRYSPIYIPGRINLMKCHLALGQLDSARHQETVLDSLFKIPLYGRQWGEMSYPEYRLTQLNLKIKCCDYSSALPLIGDLDERMKSYHHNDRRAKLINLYYDQCVIYYHLNDYLKAIQAAEAYLEYCPNDAGILRMRQDLLNRKSP